MGTQLIAMVPASPMAGRDVPDRCQQRSGGGPEPVAAGAHWML